MIDLGTQHSDFYDKDMHKVMLTFELPNELIEDKEGKLMPMLTSREYTLSLHEKSNLGQDLVAWRGKDFTEEEMKGFDITKVLGAACTVSIAHTKGNDGKTYANTKGVMAALKGSTTPPAVHECFAYLIEDGTGGNYDKLPEWIQKKINKSNEFLKPSTEEVKEIMGEVKEGFGDIDTSDLPF